MTTRHLFIEGIKEGDVIIINNKKKRGTGILMEVGKNTIDARTFKLRKLKKKEKGQ